VRSNTNNGNHRTLVSPAGSTHTAKTKQRWRSYVTHSGAQTSLAHLCLYCTTRSATQLPGVSSGSKTRPIREREREREREKYKLDKDNSENQEGTGPKTRQGQLNNITLLSERKEGWRARGESAREQDCVIIQSLFLFPRRLSHSHFFKDVPKLRKDHKIHTIPALCIGTAVQSINHLFIHAYAYSVCVCVCVCVSFNNKKTDICS